MVGRTSLEHGPEPGGRQLAAPPAEASPTVLPLAPVRADSGSPITSDAAASYPALASRSRRISAGVVDFVAVAFMTMAAPILILLVWASTTGGGDFAAVLWILLWPVLTMWAYNVYTYGQGQTFGKRLLGIAVMDARDSKPMTRTRMICRQLMKGLALFVFPGIGLAILVPPFLQNTSGYVALDRSGFASLLVFFAGGVVGLLQAFTLPRPPWDRTASTVVVKAPLDKSKRRRDEIEASIRILGSAALIYAVVSILFITAGSTS
jgi:uncharacterized RDD family membrane protein YckC